VILKVFELYNLKIKIIVLYFGLYNLLLFIFNIN